MPPQEILERIGWDNNACCQFMTFPSPALESQLRGYSHLVVLLVEDIYRFHFRYSFDTTKKEEITYVLWEALDNANDHGSQKELPFTHGLFVAKSGICHGFLDGDGYFRREDVKALFEHKLLLGEFHGVSRHIGVKDYISPHSDVIYVDTGRGVLYCVQLLERILKV